MSTITLFLDLSPLPARGDKLRFGLHMFGAFEKAADAQERLDGLSTDLGEAELPLDPKDPAWAGVEQAFAKHLGELLPWLWSGSAIRLAVDGGKAAAYTADPITLVQDTMHPDSLDLCRRGYLSSIYDGSGKLADATLFQREKPDESGTSFSMQTLSAQATRWPSPVPQEALKTVHVLEIDRQVLQDAFDQDEGTAIAAVIALHLHGRDFAVPAAAPRVSQLQASWTATAGSDTVVFLSAGLPLKDILHPPANHDSFMHPAGSLWLRSALAHETGFTDDEAGPGQGMADHDWWSRLHDGVSAAAETPRVLIEALRRTPTATELEGDFAMTALAFCGTLRDILEPGIACAAPGVPRMFAHAREPLMIGLMSSLPSAAPPSESLDILAIATRDEWPQFDHPVLLPPLDLARVALVYCALHREAFDAPSIGTWYERLRTLSKVLEERLPDVQPAGATALSVLRRAVDVLSAEERLALLDELRVEAMRPAVRAKALLAGWNAAVVPRTGDAPRLATAKTAAKTFVATLSQAVLEKAFTDHDPAPLVLATAALDAVGSASKTRQGEDKTARFATKIERAIVDHVRNRMAGKPVQQPPLGVDPVLHFTGLEAAAADVGEEAHRWIFRKDVVDATGQPSPLVLQLDTLHDDGDVQTGETDLNQWINGYAAFFRRAQPPGARSEWACGQLGVIEARMWSGSPLLRDKHGKALLATEPQPATVSYGVRQVLLQHDDRPLLPDAGIDTVGQEGGGADAHGWSQARGFAVVADRDDLAGAGTRTRLPFLAFGVDYEAVVWAESRAGTPPDELAGTNAERAPYLLDPKVALGPVLDASPHRRELKYRRRVPISVPRVAPVLRPRNAGAGALPRTWTPLSASNHVNTAQVAWPSPRSNGPDAAPVCVLLSSAGLPTVEALPDLWTGIELAVMPPSCTWAVYDRWVGYDHASASGPSKEAWGKWRGRVHASELLISALKQAGMAEQERAAINAKIAAPEAQLDDPAVGALLVEWRPLRGDMGTPELELVPLDRPIAPPQPIPLDPSKPEHDMLLLKERGRAGPADWRVRVMVHEGSTPGSRSQRFQADTAARLLTVRLWPGEIGDLFVHSAVPQTDLASRCDLQAARSEAGHGLFGAWSARFEVATAHGLDAQQLFNHCHTRVQSSGDVTLFWRAAKPAGHTPLDPVMLAIDNVGVARPQRQAWHGTGRPAPAFPHDARSLDRIEPAHDLEDGSADPTASGVVWDAQGFAERFASSALLGVATQLPVNASETVLQEEKCGTQPDPRYFRFGVEATQRYAAIYRPLLQDKANRQAFDPVQARQSTTRNGVDFYDEWIRAYRPGAEPDEVPRPAVRLVIPLTRSLAPPADAKSADILVVLDEELNTTSPLATRLEAMIEPVYREYGSNTQPKTEVMLEQAPDPIVSGQPEDAARVALACVGPLGHTFDTDTREPYFAGVSYLVQTGGHLRDWDFVKLCFRRVLAPELMNGYYPTPSVYQQGTRIVTLPTSGTLRLAGADLAASLQGHLTLQGLATASSRIELRIDFFGMAATIALLHAPLTGGGRRWTLEGTPPNGALLDAKWTVQQCWAAQPSARVLAVDARVFLARIREPNIQEKVPARWELALYVALAQRPIATELDEDPHLPWDRRWTRVLTWQQDEPANLIASAATLAADADASHGVAQSAVRASDYTPGDWIQALPDANALPIAGEQWVKRNGTQPLELRIATPGKWELSITEAGQPAQLAWRNDPAGAGDEGQGLHHRLLVTRVVRTADGNPSEAYVGIFHCPGAGRNRFVKLEPQANPRLPPAGELRAYVLLVQKSLREYTSSAPVLGFWQAAFPGNDADPLKTTDARHRILGISQPIEGRG